MSAFRTRQAPSPTGYLHLGTARTVLFTKLMSKIHSGIYYLRLEDTDRNRLQPETANVLLGALTQLGLSPDEGLTLEKIGQPDSFYGIYQKGNFGPYIQSERVKIYQEHAQKLIDLGLAYWNYITPGEKEELVQIKSVTRKPINYLKENLERHSENKEKLTQSVENGLKDEQKPALFYKLQRDEKIKSSDELLGESTFDLSLEEDFAILKSDGFPTYHLAHLIDDHLMETSLVIRSQEWLPSLPKHATMFRDYWQEIPAYLHLPFILGETGNKKMSKRDGNVNMADYLDNGFLPEAVINYLAFLGWNPGTEKELYLEKEDFLNLTQNQRLEKLISNLAADFSLETLSKSPARFNLQKLEWFNKEYLKMVSLEEFAKLAFENKIKKSQIEIKNEELELKNNLGYRAGDYAFLVDLSEQKIAATKSLRHERTFGGQHYLIGGGRKAGENPMENLSREVDEETYSKIKIDPEKAKFITKFRTHKEYEYPGEGLYAGRELNVYFYNIKMEDLPAFELEDVDKYWMEWFDISDFLENNDYLGYPIWRNFCLENELDCLEQSKQIQKQYLAWSLDKNRVTVLSEFGLDSDCILNYTKPSVEIIKWKKDSVETSLANLKEIFAVVEGLYPKFEIQQKELYNSVLLPDFEDKFQLSVNFWETELKKWLTENQKQVGNYLWPLRVALSGKEKSPSPFELLAILKLEEFRSRIEPYSVEIMEN